MAKTEQKKVEYKATQHADRKTVGQPAPEKTAGDLVREAAAKKAASKNTK